MDFGVPIAGGGAIAVLAIVIAAFFRLIRTQNRRDAITDYRLECVELERDHCTRNFGILATSVIRAGGEVDPILWEPPPKPNRRDPRMPRRSKRGEED